MNFKYLINGQKVCLIGKTEDGRNVVSKYFQWELYDEDQDAEIAYESISDEVMIVDQVFDSPPTEILDQRIVDLHGQIKNLQSRIKDLDREEQRIKEEIRKASDATKWIMNFEPFRKAKKIAFFTERKIRPVVTEDGNKVTFAIDLKKTSLKYGVRSWFYNLNDNSDFVDMETGFLFDVDDEELKRITIERVRRLRLSDLYITFADLEFIPEDLRPRAAGIIKAKLQEELNRREQELKRQMNSIESVQSEIETVQNLISDEKGK